MSIKYKAIVTGPKEYLKEGFLVEIFEITQEDIDEYLSDGDGDEDIENLDRLDALNVQDDDEEE